jgi:formylmethanofuran dehydrogenase subunit E
MPLKPLEDYEKLAERAHGHLCAGQILGIRMALYGLCLLGIDDPEGTQRKRLIAFVEIDRCAMDAISVVTGCRPGKRTMKFVDYGKTAATFCDLQRHKAVRVCARESSRELADRMHPEVPDSNARQMLAYRELPDSDLFHSQWVRVSLPPEDLPGHHAPRAACSKCGEGVAFGREVIRDGAPCCRACAGDSYYEPLG